MPQGKLRNRNYFSHSNQIKIIGMKLHRILVVIMLLQQMKTTDAAKYKGDSCVSKTQPGICKEWGECPIIKTLIENGEYTSREVVSCGFGIKEELICCPVIRTDLKPSETTTVENKDRFTEPSTTQAPVRDFWLDLLENTTSLTTATPDFWLDLLKPTTTTTTTTIKPLIVGDQKLNKSSEFYDFNALLGGNQNGGSKQERQTNLGNRRPNNNPSNQGFIPLNGNDRVNLNTGPVNINQWSFDQTGNNFNGVPAGGNNGNINFQGNGNRHIGWGQQNNGRGPFNDQQNSNRGSNMGRGPQNNQGRGHNGRGPHNNGRIRNGLGMGNPNHGFVLIENNMRPNNFFGDVDTENRRPGRPVNNMQEQNPNTVIVTNPITTNNKHINNNEDKKVDDLIKNVFDTSNTADVDTETSPVLDQKKPTEVVLEQSIANIFNVNKPQNPSLNSDNTPASQIHFPQPVVWLTPQDNINNHEVEFAEQHTLHQRLPGNYEIIPVEEQQMNGNDLDVAPSTSFIQQPVVVETWSSQPVHREDFNPIQAVYENLVNSGMDIIKAQDNQVEHVFNQHQQQQFHQPSGQVVIMQPHQHTQQPQFIHQQSEAPQNFGQHISQQLVQQPLQMESSGKEPRSTSPLQQFVQQTNSGSTMNIQSPPTNVLDPFKPFEFRQPPEDENNFLEDNNSLSTNPTSKKPDTKTNEDRPAVRACRRIEGGLTASLSPHILGGIPAEMGEFPHMAAIGYSRIGGDDRPPYDIRCGGTLIDKRFVLTAAHCVSERENVPSIVRLGVVNFTDANQMKAAVELRIRETYIHDEYSTRLTYNDIAILELERDVEFSEYIYPVCLYTDEKDPDTKIKLWVTGWGTVNTTTRSFSDILLKAPLHTSSLDHCNKSFTDYGLNRRIPEGIKRTQFCAEDKDQIKDACQGDSGGPLNMIIDESYKNYRLVGVVSSGFGCASSTPGLYTRVAAFLNFIEKVVWPTGGD